MASGSARESEPDAGEVVGRAEVISGLVSL